MPCFDPRYDSIDIAAEWNEREEQREREDDERRAAFLALPFEAQEDLIQAECDLVRFTRKAA